MKPKYSGLAAKIVLFIAGCLVGAVAVAHADDKIFISQIQTAGIKTTDDFVEIFNPNANPFNLKGYRLVKRAASSTIDTLIKSWTVDTLVPAQGFYLWANSNFTGIAKPADITTSVSIADDNGIAIRQGSNDTGIIVDSAAWGNTDNGFRSVSVINMEANKSLLRQNLYDATSIFTISESVPRNTTDHDGAVLATTTPTTTPETTATTTQETTVSTSSPASTNTQGQAPASTGGSQNTSAITFVKTGAITITEVYPNPPSDDSGKEAVELYNLSTETVSLAGWLLDDKSDKGVKSSAYTIDGITINPGEYKVIIIPAGHFALNNTKGDVVNLYYPDKTLAHQVIYTDDAKEDMSFQKVDSQWLWNMPTLRKANAIPLKTELNTALISLNELVPNPEGVDEGKEWVEIKNNASSTINLKGFVLDTVSNGAGTTTQALVLDDKSVISANGLLIVTIPEDSFSLGNSMGGIRLFSPSGAEIETVEYANAPEGKSYGKNTQGQWVFSMPTPGLENAVQADYHIRISELLPNPAADQEEFVELYNEDNSSTTLTGLKLVIGTKSLILTDVVIEPHGYYVVYEDDLPSHIRNSGGEVTLLDPFGQVVSKVSFNKSTKGQSYAYAEGLERYVWTESVTPGEINSFVLGAETSEPTPAVESNTSEKKAVTKEKEPSVTKLFNEMKKENKELKDQVTHMQEQLAELKEILPKAMQVEPVQAAEQPSVNPLATNVEKSKKPTPYYIGSIIALILLGLIIYFKNPFK